MAARDGSVAENGSGLEMDGQGGTTDLPVDVPSITQIKSSMPDSEEVGYDEDSVRMYLREIGRVALKWTPSSGQR